MRGYSVVFASGVDEASLSAALSQPDCCPARRLPAERSTRGNHASVRCAVRVEYVASCVRFLTRVDRADVFRTLCGDSLLHAVLLKGFLLILQAREIFSDAILDSLHL